MNNDFYTRFLYKIAGVDERMIKLSGVTLTSEKLFGLFLGRITVTTKFNKVTAIFNKISKWLGLYWNKNKKEKKLTVKDHIEDLQGHMHTVGVHTRKIDKELSEVQRRLDACERANIPEEEPKSLMDIPEEEPIVLEEVAGKQKSGRVSTMVIDDKETITRTDGTVETVKSHTKNLFAHNGFTLEPIMT